MRRTLVAALLALVTSIGLVSVGAPSATASTSTRTGYTQVVVAPDVYALIGSAGITPAPVGGAQAFAFRDTLAARFPITGYSFGSLRIRHSGGISLTAGAATIALSDFNIDLGRGKVSGNVAGTIGDVGRVDLFRIVGSNRLDLGLVRLKPTDTAAGALNATFGVEAFSAGDTFGYATPRPFGRF